MTFSSINPATGVVLAEFLELTPAELELRLQRAAEAALRWRFTAIDERVAVVARLGELLEEDKERLGRIMTLEMGKPIRAAIDEAAKCAMACRFYAQRGPAFMADEAVADTDHRSFVSYEPLGVVLAVMPWNFPFWQVVRFLAPALVAGNVGLLKHASNVPQCALELELLVRRAGAPDGVFQTLLVGSDAVSGIIADPRVSAVTLTGSEGAGRSVAAAAGTALFIQALALGGRHDLIVDAVNEIEAAAQVAQVQVRGQGRGQGF